MTAKEAAQIRIFLIFSTILGMFDHLFHPAPPPPETWLPVKPASDGMSGVMSSRGAVPVV